MMLAIDGPSVSTVAPLGVCVRIHRPASRPPGTPPVPASTSVAFVRNARWTVTGSRLSTTRAHTAAGSAWAAPHRRRPAVSRRSGDPVVARMGHRTRPARADRRAGARTVDAGAPNVHAPRAASTATAGTTGSRYWNPLTGHSWKARTGASV